MYDSGRAAADIVAADGLAQISDSSSLEPIVKRVVGAHPDIVAEIRAGKDRKFQFLVGQVMKETKGKGDPEAGHRAHAGGHQFLTMLIRAAGIYLVAALVLTWPLAIHLTSRLGAVEGAGDPYLNLWILGWGMKAWLADPMSVLNGRVFDANIFHPAAGTLTYSDHLLLQSLALSPLYAVTGNLALCYNVLLIASLTLSGLAMHVLARSVTGSDARPP